MNLSLQGFSHLCIADFSSYFAPKRTSDFSAGINISPDSCFTATQTLDLERAIKSARAFARKGLEVATSAVSSDKLLFSTFFNEADREIVKTAFQSVIAILTKQSQFPVVLTCIDHGDCDVDRTATLFI